MPHSLGDLEQQRSDIARQLTALGDFRPGSISTTSGRCGKPNCRCHRPNQPEHGPTDRLAPRHIAPLLVVAACGHHHHTRAYAEIKETSYASTPLLPSRCSNVTFAPSESDL